MEIISNKTKKNCEVFLLKKSNCLYINHPDYRFVDVSLGSGDNEVMIILTTEEDEALKNPFLVMTVSTSIKNVEALYSHPDKGTTLISILDSSLVFDELESQIEKLNNK